MTTTRTAAGTIIYRVYRLQHVCPYFIVKRRVISTRAASTATHYCWFVLRVAVGGRRRRRSVWLTSIWSHMLNRCRGRRMPPPPYCYCIGRPPSPLWMRSDKRARATNIIAGEWNTPDRVGHYIITILLLLLYTVHEYTRLWPRDNLAFSPTFVTSERQRCQSARESLYVTPPQFERYHYTVVPHRSVQCYAISTQLLLLLLSLWIHFQEYGIFIGPWLLPWIKLTLATWKYSGRSVSTISWSGLIWGATEDRIPSKTPLNVNFFMSSHVAWR